MITRHIWSLSFAALLAAPAVGEVPEEFLSTPAALAFGAPPTISDPRLSPDGTKVIFLQQDPEGISLLSSLDVMTGALTTLMAGSEGGYDILWCDWANDTRVLCDLRRGVPGVTNEYQMYYAVNSDGTELTEMRRTAPCGSYDYSRDTPPIDWLPEDPENVMIVCGGEARQLNVYSSRITDVSGAGQAGSGQRLYSDNHGLGKLYQTNENNLVRWFMRDDVKASWELFHETNPLVFDNPLRPIGFGENLDELFHVAWDSSRWALYSMNLADGEFDSRLLVAHETHDLELVDVLGAHDRVVAIPYLDGRVQRHIVDARVAAVHAALSEQLPGPIFEIVDESWDGNTYLVLARDARRAGIYFLYNPETESLQAIAPEYAHLAEYNLAETRTVEFETADGAQVSAHLTLPEGVEGPIPAVIIPRASPSHLDVAEPHYLVQYLAANGYAVLRVGSRGFDEYGGGGWLPVRAVAGWNQAADDLNDAVRYLVDEGITSDDTVCAMGRNYGAYAALMTAIKYPALYDCIVSIAGVTNPRVIPGASTISNAVSNIGRDVLDEASPNRRAGEIEPPILMFHGRGDFDFPMDIHAVSFEGVLKRANKDVTFIQYTDADHEIRQGHYRVDMLTRIGEFLAEHIGTAELVSTATE